jgi:hypothetical protein
MIKAVVLFNKKGNLKLIPVGAGRVRLWRHVFIVLV